MSVPTTVDGAAPRWQGEVVSDLALPTTPHVAWMSTTSWTGPDGTACWGEDHDSWSPRRRRALSGGEKR